MKIQRKASSGTMQSSDLMVVVEPSETLQIEIESTVKKQFEHLIRAQITATLNQLGVQTGRIQISDRGALDYAIAARIETAIKRSSEE
ncbi:MAG: citrate lyase acyl carrier protein [Holophaga sp.]|nr:citrate lyase acyl carrier protein [Holophaga sp.]